MNQNQKTQLARIARLLFMGLVATGGIQLLQGGPLTGKLVVTVVITAAEWAWRQAYPASPAWAPPAPPAP
jgi:hypothetical protein